MEDLAYAVLILMGLVIVTTFILYLSGMKKNIPFFNWFELHYTMAIVGILAIILLAVLGKLESNAVTSLFGALIAYVLGASTGKSRSSSTDPDQSAQTQTASPAPATVQPLPQAPSQATTDQSTQIPV